MEWSRWGWDGEEMEEMSRGSYSRSTKFIVNTKRSKSDLALEPCERNEDRILKICDFTHPTNGKPRTNNFTYFYFFMDFSTDIYPFWDAANIVIPHFPFSSLCLLGQHSAKTIQAQTFEIPVYGMAFFFSSSKVSLSLR